MAHACSVVALCELVGGDILRKGRLLMVLGRHGMRIMLSAPMAFTFRYVCFQRATLKAVEVN